MIFQKSSLKKALKGSQAPWSLRTGDMVSAGRKKVKQQYTYRGLDNLFESGSGRILKVTHFIFLGGESNEFYI